VLYIADITLKVFYLSIDITNEPDTLALRAKWEARGVPSSLFNEFIAKANEEYNSTIGYDDFNRFQMLTINLIDNDETADCYYLYTISNNGLVLFGNKDPFTSRIFGEVPCISLNIEVFKILNDDSNVIAYGQASLNHSKDETQAITLTSIGTFISNVTVETDFTYLGTFTANANTYYTFQNKSFSESDNALISILMSTDADWIDGDYWEIEISNISHTQAIQATRSQTSGNNRSIFYGTLLNIPVGWYDIKLRLHQRNWNSNTSFIVIKRYQ
jgi:hypothetical protein